MVYLKVIQKITPMDVYVSETINQKTYLKKFRGGGFRPLSSTLDPPMLHVTTQKLIWQCSVFRTTLLFVMKQKQDALLVYQKRKFYLHKAFKTFILAIPATKIVEFCAFVYLKNERIVAS